jgi:hypothetical protein
VFLVFLPFGVLALHKVNRRPTRQFTIRGMMLFIFLWAVCLSQLSGIQFDSPPGAISWLQSGIVSFAWIVLAVFYATTRQFAPLLLHVAGALFLVSVLTVGFLPGGGKTWSRFEWCICVGMGGGSFLSLIFFSLMMLLTILRRPLSPPPRKENPKP